MSEEWQELETLSDIWIPTETGEELIGEIKNRTEGNYGPQWIIKTSEGEFRTPSHKVLQNRLDAVQIGTTVKIVYEGEEAPKIRSQNPTKMYKVFTK